MRRELARWRARAEMIPDPTLRRDALFTHRTKSRHSEGLAAFAILARRAHRAEVVRAEVAFELMLDYLDTLSEQPTEDIFANGLQLHLAFADAVDPSASLQDYYALHPHRDDGGYLAAKVAACRQTIGSLPSYPVVRENLRTLARVSGEGQSLGHALLYGLEEEKVASWSGETARRVALDQEVEWWEMMAAASSSLPIGALIAAGADPDLNPEDVPRIQAAYFPWAGALSTLLDCLVDLDSDPVEANQLHRYASMEDAADRLAAIASRSQQLASGLPQAEMHQLIVAGMGGYYLAQANTWLPERGRIPTRTLEALGRYGRPTLAVHCLRQHRTRPALRVVAGGTAA